MMAPCGRRRRSFERFLAWGCTNVGLQLTQQPTAVRAIGIATISDAGRSGNGFSTLTVDVEPGGVDTILLHLLQRRPHG